MGIDYHGYKFLKYIKIHYGDLNNVVCLGRLRFNLINRDRVLFNLESIKYFDEMDKSILGIGSIDSIDYSDYGGANITIDLNEPINNDLIGSYDTVIDYGTTEHVFNVKQVFENCDLLIKNGGKIIHMLPSNNFNGHGFYQFSPELFYSYYSESNGYEVEIFLSNPYRKKYWYKFNKQDLGKRLYINIKGPLTLLVIANKNRNVEKLEIFQSDYTYKWTMAKNQYINNNKKNIIKRLVRKTLIFIGLYEFARLQMQKSRLRLSQKLFRLNITKL